MYLLQGKRVFLPKSTTDYHPLGFPKANFGSEKCQHIYQKKTFISQRVIFRFLPKLQRLSKTYKSVKSINLKTN